MANQKNSPVTSQEITRTVNQALSYVRSNPCCICSYEGLCGIKYKGVCKVARQLRIRLLKAETTEASKAPWIE